VIADHCGPLDPEQTQDLQDLVLPEAGELTTTELRDITGQAVIIVDPDGAEHRHQDAAASRDLRMQPEPDGMATLKAQLPADGAVKIFQVTDLLATGTAGTPGDNTGIGARRVDALVDIATTYSPTESSTSPTTSAPNSPTTAPPPPAPTPTPAPAPPAIPQNPPRPATSKTSSPPP
jgi:hypothetical protein